MKQITDKPVVVTIPPNISKVDDLGNGRGGTLLNQNQTAAFVSAQTAMFLCRLEGMKAENSLYLHRGYEPVYTEHHFTCLENEWEPIIGYNAVTLLFRDATD